MSPPGALSPIGKIIRAGGKFSPISKVTWPELKCIGVRRTRIVDSVSYTHLTLPTNREV